ncbi:RNA 2',3'-cyclic phosphodiesterase [Tropicimonas sp. IMCC6043]|uniref:RNA 2',3'-cyclic phosphodiesterase n=1 Tax=Tropicimonas sp. IMCC6043 TaxID=2510645 RepID=UPI00101D25DD|nr:RNA 2',3'-cyclic phosphodiesterase [Tropicimonas sp. IMCC6043]RYH10842.1 RNA 2',3'-cyclic phosphodiesterase [Tropicimonas sp. IMCC6043]
MRLFVAISLPEGLLDRLEALAARLALGRPTPRENLHLTLAFLDEVAETVLPELDDALGAIHLPSVPVAFTGLDLFGARSPEILHASVRQAPGLIQLHESVLRAARGTGLSLARRRYRPHVTLARFNRPPATDRLGAFLADNALAPLPGFEAESFALFRSTLGHGPARHEELARYPLGVLSGTSGPGLPEA